MGSGSMGVRSKIRHHGMLKATGYSYANMVGGGVPMRLSASEVGDEGNHYDDSDRKTSMNNQRTSTGKSTGENKWLDIDQKHRNRYSQGSTVQGESPNEDIPELEESPGIGEQPQQKGEYFPRVAGHGSGSSSEKENNFGQVGQMGAPRSVEKARKTSDELRRRGSVDERTNTMGYMGQGRLFVANPDLSDWYLLGEVYCIHDTALLTAYDMIGVYWPSGKVDRVWWGGIGMNHLIMDDRIVDCVILNWLYCDISRSEWAYCRVTAGKT